MDQFIYTKPHCWQYDRKLATYPEDMANLPFTENDLRQMRIQDFEFKYIPKDNKLECNHLVKFIERYEGLGKVHIWTTHRFATYHKNTGLLAGVVLMATPNRVTNLLGKSYSNREKLISRGASASWTPKNLASWMIMQSINWMVRNTDFVLFTAYADPMAKELGTIYQACNFYYLGQSFGSPKTYYNPDRPEVGLVSERYFTYRSMYVKTAKRLGITWKREWYILGKNKRKVNWKNIPDDIAKQLKQAVKDEKKGWIPVQSKPKHKYCYILGKNKAETGQLRKLFGQLNPELIGLEYPKER